MPLFYETNIIKSREKYDPDNKIVLIFQHKEDNTILEIPLSLSEYSKINSLVRKYTIEDMNGRNNANYVLLKIVSVSLE